MRTQFVSDVLNKVFDSEEECREAEKKFAAKELEKQALAEEKAERYNEVKQAFLDYLEAEKKAFKKYEDLADKFIQDYGELNIEYEEEVEDEPEKNVTLSDLLNVLFR